LMSPGDSKICAIIPCGAPHGGTSAKLPTPRFVVVCSLAHIARMTSNPTGLLRAAARSDSDTTETESSCSDVESSIASADAKRSISIPWSPPLARRRKGVVHLPASHDLDSRDRDALLTAIAKARSWIDDLINGRVQSFDEIADREQKVVRHIRFLVPLAFLSPRIVAAIANGDVPAGVTVSGLVRSLPFNWAEQQRRFALF
jgi:site-specific DNA recombinase